MELLLLILIGVFYGTGIFMMLRRSMVKLLIGLILLGNGANLLIFLLGVSPAVNRPSFLKLKKR
ncbi:NADH-quinone oxidoreductase subunit K [Chitinophaga sedimenti]|uniref:NADH-quinone oxidoreductase subunit K n=1 Tax=Chitinophaga sedimenti TaxID=2033606 RepID=UPI0020049553|nr:NADH-quinone oxidoreductase subunit K [Chitinophaga sedimenti]MCK7558429.1 NADH-quinone oxidoreductase subunit K [Chitinophaga sedimenti]